MKRILITTALLSAFAAASVFAYPGAGMGYGMGGYGAGYGMMGGYGGGPGWEEGCHSDAGPALNLSSEQRAKLDDIQRDLWNRQQALMVRMHDQDFHMHDLYAPGVDEARARKAFDAMTAARKEMFEASLEAGKRMDAILNDEQRKLLRQR